MKIRENSPRISGNAAVEHGCNQEEISGPGGGGHLVRVGLGVEVMAGGALMRILILKRWARMIGWFGMSDLDC